MDGIEEMYSIKRNISDEQIHLDYAIHYFFNNANSFFGEINDPEGIECQTETNVDQSVSDEAGILQRAWIQLDIKVTPIK